MNYVLPATVFISAPKTAVGDRIVEHVSTEIITVEDEHCLKGLFLQYFVSLNSSIVLFKVDVLIGSFWFE